MLEILCWPGAIPLGCFPRVWRKQHNTPVRWEYGRAFSINEPVCGSISQHHIKDSRCLVHHNRIPLPNHKHLGCVGLVCHLDCLIGDIQIVGQRQAKSTRCVVRCHKASHEDESDHLGQGQNSQHGSASDRQGAGPHGNPGPGSAEDILRSSPDNQIGSRSHQGKKV